MQEENPREIFLASQEILSTIEWADALQDHNAASGAIALFDAHIGVLLEGTSLSRHMHYDNFPSCVN